MRTDEWVLGLFGMVKVKHGRPGLGCMTLVAFLGKLWLMKVGVTVPTRGIDGAIVAIFVTTITRDLGVFAFKLKPSAPMVEERNSPCFKPIMAL